MISRDVLVVGAGPAGLCAAIEAGRAGADVLLVDMNLKPGGQLFKQIHKFFGSSVHRSGTRGYDIGLQLLEEAKDNKVEIWLRSTVIGIFPDNQVGIERQTETGDKQLVTVQAREIVLATGASENTVRFKGWTTPGVMGAGAAQTMVNVNHVKPGQRVLMVGSGNVGLIVSYQLMQAGCEVAALVDAAPTIGGYAVHAAKIRRAGVPIWLRHTVLEVEKDKKGCVCAAVVTEVDDTYQPIPGSEKRVECDTVALAVGLKPVTELVKMAECGLAFHAPFGGWVPLHNERMESTQKGIYVAGDATGVEEANTALEEGRLAGISAAEDLGLIDNAAAGIMRDEIWGRLKALRTGPFGDRRCHEKALMLEEYSDITPEERKSGEELQEKICL